MRRLTFVAEAGGLHDVAARGHLQQRREVRLSLDDGAADRDAQCGLGGGPRVQGAPAADVQDLAVRVTNEIAFAVDLLHEAFALEYGESSPQGHRADLVPVGKASFGRKAFAGLHTARGDLLPEVVGDVVVTCAHRVGHRLLNMRTATNRVRACMVSSSPDSKSSCFAP